MQGTVHAQHNHYENKNGLRGMSKRDVPWGHKGMHMQLRCIHPAWGLRGALAAGSAAGCAHLGAHSFPNNKGAHAATEVWECCRECSARSVQFSEPQRCTCSHRGAFAAGRAAGSAQLGAHSFLSHKGARAATEVYCKAQREYAARLPRCTCSYRCA
eukprot:1145661-Pelagomonas_calceolata.AAC.1